MKLIMKLLVTVKKKIGWMGICGKDKKIWKPYVCGNCPMLKIGHP